MPFRVHERSESPSVWRSLFLSAAAGVLLSIIIYFASGISEEIRDLSTTHSDNVQWNLSQSEVEFLTLALLAREVASDETEDLSKVRTAFDIAYSRLVTLEAADLYQGIRSMPKMTENITLVRAFLDRWLPVIDGSDAGLRAALPRLALEAKETHALVRAISVSGIHYFSQKRDMMRSGVSMTLFSIATLGLGLLVVLVILMSSMHRMNRENKRRAAEYKLAMNHLSTIVSSSPDAIVVADSFGRIVEFNGAAEAIFGYSRDMALGRTVADLIVPFHLRRQHEIGMRRYAETRKKHMLDRGRIRMQARRKNGQEFPVEFSIATAQDLSGDLFVSFLRDISAEVAAEDELMRARDSAIAGEQSKAKFFAVMSHEMRTPLNGLLGTIELMSATAMSSKQKRLLKIMEDSGQFLLQHINDLLGITRIESGNYEINEAVFDLGALIDDLLDTQRAAAQKNGNRLAEFKRESSAPLLMLGDLQRIKQVLLNLIGNAIKFTRNGLITVEAEQLVADGMMEIRVHDTGIGIKASDTEAIFEDFTTVDSSFSRQVEGTGLGLSIARRIVEAMGGKIGVESEYGEGSMFWVRLPGLLQGAEDHLDVIEPASPRQFGLPVPKLKILLVEDNAINRTVVKQLLEVDEHIVDEAHDGALGVELAHERHYDLILMDISMPGIDGIEALERIRSGGGASASVPVFALTAHALDENRRRFREAGMAEVIIKPITRNRLREVLFRHFGADKRDPEGKGLRFGLHSSGTSQSGLIDASTLDQLREAIEADTFLRLLNLFVAEIDHELAAGKLTAADAHRLAGSAAVFGASQLRAKLIALETLLTDDPTADLTSSMAEMTEVWKRTRAELVDAS